MGADFTTFVTRGQAEMRVALGVLDVSDDVLEEVLHLIHGNRLEYFQIRADADDLRRPEDDED